MQTVSSWSWPTHTRPPKAGAGFVHVRRRVFIAKPQVCEHADQDDQAVQSPWTVQLVTLTLAPEQVAPPCCGGGLLQSRVWHWQVSEPWWKQGFAFDLSPSICALRRHERQRATDLPSRHEGANAHANENVHDPWCRVDTETKSSRHSSHRPQDLWEQGTWWLLDASDWQDGFASGPERISSDVRSNRNMAPEHWDKPGDFDAYGTGQRVFCKCDIPFVLEQNLTNVGPTTHIIILNLCQTAYLDRPSSVPTYRLCVSFKNCMIIGVDGKGPQTSTIQVSCVRGKTEIFLIKPTSVATYSTVTPRCNLVGVTSRAIKVNLSSKAVCNGSSVVLWIASSISWYLWLSMIWWGATFAFEPHLWRLWWDGLLSQAAPEFSWCLKGPLKLAVIADMLNAHIADPAIPLLKIHVEFSEFRSLSPSSSFKKRKKESRRRVC